MLCSHHVIVKQAKARPLADLSLHSYISAPLRCGNASWQRHWQQNEWRVNLVQINTLRKKAVKFINTWVDLCCANTAIHKGTRPYYPFCCCCCLLRMLNQLCSHCKQTTPGLEWNQVETTSHRRSQLGCFAPHPSAPKWKCPLVLKRLQLIYAWKHT